MACLSKDVTKSSSSSFQLRIISSSVLFFKFDGNDTTEGSDDVGIIEAVAVLAGLSADSAVVLAGAIVDAVGCLEAASASAPGFAAVSVVDGNLNENAGLDSSFFSAGFKDASAAVEGVGKGALDCVPNENNPGFEAVSVVAEGADVPPVKGVLDGKLNPTVGGFVDGAAKVEVADVAVAIEGVGLEMPDGAGVVAAVVVLPKLSGADAVVAVVLAPKSPVPPEEGCAVCPNENPLAGGAETVD